MIVTNLAMVLPLAEEEGPLLWMLGVVPSLDLTTLPLAWTSTLSAKLVLVLRVSQTWAQVIKGPGTDCFPSRLDWDTSDRVYKSIGCQRQDTCRTGGSGGQRWLLLPASGHSLLARPPLPGLILLIIPHQSLWWIPCHKHWVRYHCHGINSPPFLG